MDLQGDTAINNVNSGGIAPGVPVRHKEVTSPGDDGGDGKCEENTKSSTEWVIQAEQRFKRKIYKLRESSKNVCIFKVPHSLRDSKPEAYNPQVPLGPFFNSQDNQDLPSTDDLKLSAVEATLERLKVPKIEAMIDSVMKCMDKIRDCYQYRAAECNEKKLAWMMVMDACFIIETFFDSNQKKDLNSFFGVIRSDIKMDILKLENQIPLVVLKCILELHRDENAVSNFARKVCDELEFKGCPFSTGRERQKELERKLILHIIKEDAAHLLDVYRIEINDFLICSSSNFDSVYNDHLSSAENLTKAGIKFKPSDDGKVRFERTYGASATLFLPEITVDDNTETHLRNLMALEECRYSVKSNDNRMISNYICLLDDLIDSKEDVALLKKAKIIRSFMGSDEEITDMFNALCKGITDDKSSAYGDVFKDIEDYHKACSFIIEVKKQYCTKPWQIVFVSLTVAVLYFGMTALQTAFTVKNN